MRKERIVEWSEEPIGGVTREEPVVENEVKTKSIVEDEPEGEI